ncbi:MAG: hypothetical protein KBS66_08140, partial [Eubacterium sp.]|nr:hypothetical protein [Candidatus Colimonas fimequi]
MRKKLLSIILTLTMVLTMIPAMGSVAYAADETGKTVITTIEGTSNISDVLVLGNELVNPTITITSGWPASYNPAGIMNWYRKVDGNWVQCENYTTVIPGEYRLEFARFGIYNNTIDQYYTHFDLCGETTVTIDGVEWNTVIA